MADLLTLNEAKNFLGIQLADNRKDTLISAVIPAASQAILTYTERDFGAPTVTEERTFEYDGSGYADIDDCVSVTAVKVVVPNADDLVINADAWTAMPFRRDDSPVHTYLLLPTLGRLYPSIEMGFERNLDSYVADHGFASIPQTVKVTATWGWPTIPADVKQAAAWTIRDWTANPKGAEGLQSESIASYSRSWARFAGGGLLAIPNAAKDILVAYQRVQV